MFRRFEAYLWISLLFFKIKADLIINMSAFLVINLGLECKYFEFVVVDFGEDFSVFDYVFYA